MILPKKSWDYWLPDPRMLNDHDTRGREDVVSKAHLLISDTFTEGEEKLPALAKLSDSVYEIERMACHMQSVANDNCKVATDLRDIAVYALEYFKAFMVKADAALIAEITAWCDKKLHKDWRWFKIGDKDDYVFVIHDDVEQVHFKLRWS